MKKYSLILMVVMFCIIGLDSRKADAFSVKLEKDGMYAEVLPESVVNNSKVFFEKSVKKAMEYYEKYKDADAYTLATKVPDKYRDFMSVAKKIQDSDEIVIRNPFFIYNAAGDGGFYNYYFVAERNGKKLCLFSINIDSETGKISFNYDKSMNQYFVYDEKTMEKALFYKLDDITYAQTSEETSVVRDQTMPGGKMEGVTSEASTEEFEKKNYEGKKEEILTYLEDIKNRKSIKNSEKELKLELEDEYIEPGKESEKSTRVDVIGKVILAIIAVWVLVVVVAAVIRGKKQREE